jgi:hypothetical protein
MPLDEGTYLCLLIGIGAFLLLFRDIVLRETTAPQHTQVPVPAQVQVPAASVAAEPIPELSPEERRFRIESHLESQYRDEWLRQWEEEELKREFRVKFADNLEMKLLQGQREDAIMSGRMQLWM